jgi:tetratricopeptide (TPR) repeat protein
MVDVSQGPSHRPRCLASALAFGLLVLAGSPARGQSEGGDEALELYRKSEESYKAGRLEDAIELLRRAYDKRPEPAFLFNMGRAYERLRDLPHAIEAYSRYLDAEPAAKNRADVSRTIATMRHQQAEIEALERRHRAEMEALRGAQARERTESDEKTRGAQLVLPKVIVGVGAAGILAGGVFGVVALEREGAAEREKAQLAAAQDLDSARVFGAVSTGTFIAGGVLATAGLVWWFLGSRSKPADPSERGGRVARLSPPAALSWSW